MTYKPGKSGPSKSGGKPRPGGRSGGPGKSGKPFKKNFRTDSGPKREGAGSDRPPYRGGGDGDRPPYRGNSDRPPYQGGGGGDRPQYRGGGSNDRPPYRGNSDRPSYQGGRGGDRPQYRGGSSNDRPPYRGNSDRPPYQGGGGDRPQYRDGGSNERPPYRGNSDRPPYQGGGGGDRPQYRGGGSSDRPPQRGGGGGDRPSYRGNSDRPPYQGGGGGDRPQYRGGGSSDRPPYRGNSDRPPFQGGGDDRPDIRSSSEREAAGGRDERPPYRGNDDRPQRPAYRGNDDRPQRPPFRGDNDRPRQDQGSRPPFREQRGPGTYGPKRSSDRPYQGAPQRSAPKNQLPDALIYGINPVSVALEHGKLRRLFVDQSSSNPRVLDLVETAETAGVEIVSLESQGWGDALSRDMHQGAAGLLSGRSFVHLEEIAKMGTEASTILFLDKIQDPHNLGAVLRTAAATGVHAVVLPKTGGCGLTPAVHKASAGMSLIVNVVEDVNFAQALDMLKERGYWVVGCDSGAGEDATSFEFPARRVLVMGSEGAGIRRLVRERCDHLVKLPMASGVESLNISVATGVMLYLGNANAQDEGQTMPSRPETGLASAAAESVSSAETSSDADAPLAPLEE